MRGAVAPTQWRPTLRSIEPLPTETARRSPSQGRAVDRDFFDRAVLDVAEDLIGAQLHVAGVGGRIVEVEAYDRFDPASHSFRGPTPRNAPMFGAPGHAYVYRIYGLHWCLNFVCGEIGSAVLVRALEPTLGLGVMRERRGDVPPRALCSGPGRLCQALGISGAYNGLPLDQAPFKLAQAAVRPLTTSGPRIGLTRGVETPWRYGEASSRFLSRPFRSS